MAATLFEHRHFTKIAEIIAELPEEQRDDIANHFAFALRSTNPKFDYDRFETAARGKAINGRDQPARTSRQPDGRAREAEGAMEPGPMSQGFARRLRDPWGP